jgi:hydroxyethylthiazole kinase-like uncharacterized protein yjeF
MEHAAQGVAALAALLLEPGEGVLALCGPGNNGGDGYGAARFLAAWGVPVRVLRCAPAPPARGDAAVEAALAARAAGAVASAWERPEAVADALAERPALVLDALFGVGLARPLGAPYAGWIEALNAAPTLRLAVDVPSGLDADTGEERPVAVRAQVTATLGAPKRGLLAAPRAAGRVVVVDIGLPGHRP